MEHNLWRADFPQITEKEEIYLDNAASSLKPNSVIAAIQHYYHDLSANVHRGVYKESYEATTLYEEAREKIAQFIHADIKETIFTRGGTASLNLVANSYGLSHLHAGDEIITSELEHHSSVLPWMNVAKKTGAKLVYIPLDPDGRITVEAFLSVLTAKTKVLALTYVSNVMGYITPIAEIIRLAHAQNVIVVVDAAQAVQHLHLDVKALDCDFLAFSGHKMLGPTGIGILYGKEALLNAMEPTEFGGDMNDNVDQFDAEWKDLPYKFEAGTMPIAEVIGLGAAVDYWNAHSMVDMEDHVRRMRQYVITQLKKMPDLVIYNPQADTGIISFNIVGVHSHDASTFFAEKNVCLRAGHHCAQLLIKWLHIEACLRASFYFYNTYADCDRFVDSVKEAVRFFRKMGF
jgi:cysteine desulfurase/selenocysteine lyase